MKRFSLIAAAAVVVLIVTLTAVFAGCYDSTQKQGDVQKRTSLTVRDDGTFVIMQLTDLHLTTNGNYNKDKQTLKWVEEALDTVKPEFPWRSLPLSMRQRATDKPVKEKAA